MYGHTARRKGQRRATPRVLGEGAAERGRCVCGCPSCPFSATPIYSRLGPGGAAGACAPRTASFFSDLSDLKPGDTVHVDHGIGQLKDCGRVGTDGATGEFMLLVYATMPGSTFLSRVSI